ncbi:MAG: hypothetical protein ACRBBW_03730 [Cellvibrionaceae bacterium]
MKSRVLIALTIIGLSAVFVGYLPAHLDRAQVARWLHQWQHDGMSVHIDLMAVSERWKALQAQNLDRQQLDSKVASPRPGSLGNDSLAHARLRAETLNYRDIIVDSTAALLRAVKFAQPGDRIVVAPGRYAFSGRSIELTRSGTALNPISLVAQQPWQSTFEFDLLEGFWVSGSDWHFEGLTLLGVCAKDDRCEHAFHIVGGAQRTELRHNRIHDFNAPIKINGSKGIYPDDGRISHNVIVNNRPRETKNPVVGIDGVAVSRWQVSNNLIANFKKAKGNRTSSGGFFKGAGAENRFDNNLVVCSDKVLMDYVQIGLSLGNGGSSASACRNRRCAVEQSGSHIMGNIIANCSDVGVYLNRAEDSTLINNTLYATLGIDVRFEGSSALVVNNLISGRIRERDGGEILVDQQNWMLPAQAMGRDSFEDVFHHPQGLNFSVRRDYLRRFAGVRNDEFKEDACGYRNAALSGTETSDDLAARAQFEGFIGALNPLSESDCFFSAR